MNYLRSLVFYTSFAALTVLLLPLFLVTFVIIREENFVRLTGRLWTYTFLWLAHKITKVSYSFENKEVITHSTHPFIIASKHQSMFETFCFGKEFSEKATVIMKKEIEKWPIMKSFIKRLNLITIDRNQPVHALHKMIKQAKNAKEKGLNIFLFPEGTRTKPGQTTHYNDGVYLLYKHLKMPVVTVSLNSGLFWPPRSFVKNPGHITLRITSIIDPGLSKEEFKKTLFENIELPAIELAQQKK